MGAVNSLRTLTDEQLQQEIDFWRDRRDQIDEHSNKGLARLNGCTNMIKRLRDEQIERKKILEAFGSLSLETADPRQLALPV